MGKNINWTISKIIKRRMHCQHCGRDTDQEVRNGVAWWCLLCGRLVNLYRPDQEG